MRVENVIPAEVGIASGYKIAAHRDRILAYLRGEPIHPVTLELDLTSRCSRSCRDCPSTRAPEDWELSPGFVAGLFAALGGRVPGLLLTGGEPTISPLFASTLALARRSGFGEIAVVSNGSHLDDDGVCSALLEHASAIRVSLYDWEEDVFSGAAAVFKRIEALRRRIDAGNSRLRIGVSALTSSARLGRLRRLVEAAAASGVHWLYFHPRCRHWDKGRPQPEAQAGVLDEIARLRDGFAQVLEIEASIQRYLDFPLHFSAYHAAHFMLVVGADRRNYLGAEVKYQPDFAIAELGAVPDAGFLHRPDRLARIAAHASGNYPAQGSRHRSVLYNDFIERLRHHDPESERILDSHPRFRYPHIL